MCCIAFSCKFSKILSKFSSNYSCLWAATEFPPSERTLYNQVFQMFALLLGLSLPYYDTCYGNNLWSIRPNFMILGDTWYIGIHEASPQKVEVVLQRKIIIRISTSNFRKICRRILGNLFHIVSQFQRK